MPGIFDSNIDLIEPMLKGLQHESPTMKIILKH